MVVLQKNATGQVIASGGVRFKPGGQVEKVVQYRYFCGQNGPFTLELPEAEDDPGKARKLMDEH